MQEKGKFNGVVLIRRSGETKLSRGYGFKDHFQQNKLTSSTPMRIASLSKQFTAAAIILLENHNLLDYDDAVEKYISSFPYSDVTIRNLLNQTSGIPDIYMELAIAGKDSFSILNNQIAVELLLAENAKSSFKPNEKFQYSNTNYMLLARIIELISETSFEEFMASNIFGPLNMLNTRVWNLNSKDKALGVLAEDMEFDGKRFKKLEPDFIDGVTGDGSIFTSADDLEIWDDFWKGGLLLEFTALEEALKENKLSSGETSKYGFGWMLTENGMWHNGSWLGARSMFLRNTKKESCYAIIDNSSNPFFEKILQEVEKIDRHKKFT